MWCTDGHADTILIHTKLNSCKCEEGAVGSLSVGREGGQALGECFLRLAKRDLSQSQGHLPYNRLQAQKADRCLCDLCGDSEANGSEACLTDASVGSQAT